MKINQITLALATGLLLTATAAPAQTLLFAGGKSFRVHESPSIAVSADEGRTWTLVFEGARKNMDNASWVTGLAYGAGKLVAVTNYGVVLTSADRGKTWASQDVKTPLRLNGGFNDVAYGNGLFVAAGQTDALAYSADGEHWQRLGTDNLPGAAAAPADRATTQATQGVKSKLGGFGSRLGSLGGGLVGQAASAAKSSGGSSGGSGGAAPAAGSETFHTNTDPHDETKYTHTYGVDFIDGKFYLAGNFGREAVFTVEGGKPVRVAVSRTHEKLTSALRQTVSDGKGHLVGFTEAEMNPVRSADGGQTWEEDFDLKQRLLGGAYGAGKFVGVSGFGEVGTSADGSAWQLTKIAGLNDGGSFMDAAYTGKTWVLCGNDNSSWYSADNAKTWQRTDTKGLYLKRLLVVK